MKMLIKYAAILAPGLLAIASPMTAFAADAPAPAADASVAERAAAAGKLIEVMHLDKQLDILMPQIINVLLGSLISGNTGHEDQIKGILTDEFATAFAGQKDAFLASYREIYAKNLTLAEIKAMTDFYATPVGQSVLAKLPSINQDSLKGGAEIGRKAAQTALPRIIQRMQDAKLAVPHGV
jgi:hypothetical protein